MLLGTDCKTFQNPRGTRCSGMLEFKVASRGMMLFSAADLIVALGPS